MPLGFWGPLTGFLRVFAVFSEEFWACAIEQPLDSASVLDGFLYGRDHGLGHIHGSAASLVAER